MTDNSAKNYKIINIRAIAILVIVLGHSIILYSESWGIFTTTVKSPILSLAKDVINTFQLELFFALSGFLFYKSVKKGGGNFISKKAFRLIIPYFCIAFCWMDPIKVLLSTPGFTDKRAIISSICNQSFFSSGSTGHLWYLPTLFGIFCLAYIFMKRIHRFNVLGNTILFCLLVIAYYAGFYFPNYFQINNILHYSIFFFMGYYLHYIDSYIVLDKYKWVIFLSFLLVILGRILSVHLHLLYIAVFLLSIYVFIPNNTNKFVQFISDNSFGIYLLHSPLIYITYTYFKDSSPLFVLFVNFFIFGGVSLLLSFLIRKSRLRFILGE